MPALWNVMSRMRATLKIEHESHTLVSELVNYSLLGGIEALRNSAFQNNEECFVVGCRRELVSSLLLQKGINLTRPFPAIASPYRFNLCAKSPVMAHLHAQE
jgi:hypothetical protein